MKIVLIGFMGTGKSSLGRLLAEELGYQFIDTDQIIEERQQRSIAEIFRSDGEAGFRKLEAELAQELRMADRLIVATGGGFPLNPENIRAVRDNGIVIALTATPEAIYQRVVREQHRPLLVEGDPLERITALLEARNGIYQNSDLTIDTTGKSLTEMATAIIVELRKRG
ncbi:MAG TPA: shikimate kinase [Bacillota bacterium]|nr:shikimate kinase [Bacillota bacterium]